MNERTEVNGAPTLTDRVKELRLAGKLDGGKPRGGGGTSWLPWLLCFFLAVGWSAYGIKAYKPTAKPADGGLATDPNASPGTTSSGSTSTGSGREEAVTLEVKGYLIPTQQISISPIDVAGRVIALHIEEGKSFKKGDTLAEIDPTPFLAMQAEHVATVEAARARSLETDAAVPLGIRQAEAELKEAEVNLTPAQQEWDRVRSRRDRAGLSEIDVEKAEAAFHAAASKVRVKQAALETLRKTDEARRAAAKAEWNAAVARLKQSEWKLKNCTIVSPVTGVILTKKAEVGSLLNPVVGGVSTNLCDIADLRKLEVDLEVQERDIGKVKLNMACRIKPDAYTNRVYEGYVERVMPIANRAKSVVPVRIKVVPRDDEVQGQYLKPEMGVTVTFLNRTVDDDYKAAVRKKLEDDSGASIAPKK
jgi:HlyD family secretion protein